MSRKEIEKAIEQFDWRPVTQDVDLGLNATNATVTTGLFDYITQMIITLRFADAAVEWTEFLAGSALTNGFYIAVDGTAITPVIKTKGQLMEIGVARQIAKDNDNTYVVQIVLDFEKMCAGLGGLLTKTTTGYRSLVVVIQDDLSSLSGVFVANVQGWKSI